MPENNNDFRFKKTEKKLIKNHKNPRHSFRPSFTFSQPLNKTKSQNFPSLSVPNNFVVQMGLAY